MTDYHTRAYVTFSYIILSDVRFLKVFCEMDFRRFLDRSLGKKDGNISSFEHEYRLKRMHKGILSWWFNGWEGRGFQVACKFNFHLLLKTQTQLL